MSKVTRKKDIPAYLSLGRTAVDELIALGVIRIFPLTPRGRAKAAFIDELDAYLEGQAAIIKRDQRANSKNP